MIVSRILMLRERWAFMPSGLNPSHNSDASWKLWISLCCQTQTSGEEGAESNVAPVFESALRYGGDSCFGGACAAGTEEAEVPCSFWNSFISRWAASVLPCFRYRPANAKCACPASELSFSIVRSFAHDFSAAAVSPSRDAAFPNE